MAKPIWQQKLQALLDAHPLFFIKGNRTGSVKHEECLESGEVRGKRVSLRELVNYSFNTCEKCKKEIH